MRERPDSGPIRHGSPEYQGKSPIIVSPQLYS
jgi:hypothetical protein